MPRKGALVTGWSGAIGSDPVTLLDGQGWKSYGVDNKRCGEFSGERGDTRAISEGRAYRIFG
jgi:hypothetical protein